uniref:Uncharacterized protein n=1 Tax=Panagrolaimus davidi TaxID=227884 RepID=A0A914R2C2_9BILA
MVRFISVLFIVGIALSLIEGTSGFRFKRQALPSDAPPTYPPYPGYNPGQQQQPGGYYYGNGQTYYGYQYGPYPYYGYGNYYGYQPNYGAYGTYG